jgi:hypothetical protein
MYTVIYNKSPREYVEGRTSENDIVRMEAPYGSVVTYNEIPTYIAEEGSQWYYLFDHWDKSGYVDGDKVINAVFDSCQYVDGYFDGKELSTLRPVEVYMMIQRGLYTTYTAIKDTLSITLGHDVDYIDVTSDVIIPMHSPRSFNGTSTSYYATDVYLLDEDKDFVLAIDCELSSQNSSGAALFECYSESLTTGLQFLYNNGTPSLNWNGKTENPSSVDSRDMLVLRHIKGTKGLHVYSSKISSNESFYVTLGDEWPTVNKRLVFGARERASGVFSHHAQGTVYWSKVWYTDLGDEVCKKLASWPHEQVAFRLGEYNKYFISSADEQLCSMSFLATNTVGNAVQMKDGYKNSGGWASATLNTYLNTKVYNGFPDRWRQLIKQVKVKSTIGDYSTQTSISNCYIHIPAVSEITQNTPYNNAPYTNEGSIFSHLVVDTDNSRLCYDKEGSAVSYWTRSPYKPGFNDTNIDFTQFHLITATGAIDSKYPNTNYYIRMVFSI